MCDDFNDTFTELVKLYQTDVDAYDKKCNEMIEETLAAMCIRCPERADRCRKMLWRVNKDLAKYKNPTARFNALVEGFWLDYEKFNDALHLKDLNPPVKDTSNVIAFKKK